MLNDRIKYLKTLEKHIPIFSNNLLITAGVVIKRNSLIVL